MSTEAIARTAPGVGDKVIATYIPVIDDNDSANNYSEEMKRQVVTITAIFPEPDGKTRLFADFRNPETDTTQNWYFYDWKPAEETVEPEVSPEVVLLKETISNLNEVLESERTRLRETRANFDRSMEIISGRLNEEAENRGWCDEFDRIIEDVNRTLPGPFYLEKRQREYEVTWTETYTVTVHRSAIIMATADDDAISQVQDWDEADSYDIKEAIDNGNYEYESADYYEAEEQ